MVKMVDLYHMELFSFSWNDDELCGFNGPYLIDLLQLAFAVINALNQ